MSIRRGFSDRMGAALAGAGVPAMAARVFSALMVHPHGRMTAPELASELDVSAGAVSGAVRYLSQVGMIRREHERGSRRYLYVVEDDAWHEALMRSDTTYRPMIQALREGAAGLAADDPARHRLVLTQEFLTFLQAEFRALDAKWQARRRELGI